MSVPEDDHLLKISAVLNMIIVSLHRIKTSGDRLILDSEYHNIIYNLRMSEITPYHELADMYRKILVTLQKMLLKVDRREKIESEYSERQSKSILETIKMVGSRKKLTAIATKAAVHLTEDWCASIMKFIASTASEYVQRKKEINNEQDKLKTDEINECNDLELSLWDTLCRIQERHPIPDEYIVQRDSLEEFLNDIKEPVPTTCYITLERLESDFAMYAPYWFYRTKSANEAGNDEEAKRCFMRFEEVWQRVLRKDPYRAEAMKFKIEWLIRSGITQDNIKKIEVCLEEMIRNTRSKDRTNNIIFEAEISLLLGYKEKAKKLIQSCRLGANRVNEFLAYIEETELTTVIVPDPLKQEALKTTPATMPKHPPMSDDDFLELCKSGDAAKIEEAIHNGANVNAIPSEDNDGEPALIWVVRKGYAEITEILLKNGADVNAKSNHGSTALMWSARQGYSDIAEVILKYGADVNAKNNYGSTALIWAAKHGNAEVAEVLLQHDADINATANNGLTALIWSTLGNHEHVAKILIKYGADINAKDNGGWTALMWAVRGCYAELARLLRKHGAK